MRNESDFLPFMFQENAMNLVAHLGFIQCGMSNTKADRHYLDCDDSNTIILAGKFVLVVKLSEKIYIRVEPDTDTMYKKYRQVFFRSMGAMPICQCFRW